MRSWVATELALGAAEDGDALGVTVLLPHAIEPSASRVLWRTEADAHLAAGDSAAALEAFAELFARETGTNRITAMVELGRMRVSAGDTAQGQALLLEAIDDARGRAQARAAAMLWTLRRSRTSAPWSWHGSSIGRETDRAPYGATIERSSWLRRMGSRCPNR